MGTGQEAERERIFAGNRAYGRIVLSTRARNGQTRPERVAESESLRVRFPAPGSDALEAVIVNTSGGVAGGDRFELEIAARPGARLTVTSAAAEKVYRSLGPDATVDVRLGVAAGGSLAWLPHETILFDGARLARSIDVDLAEDAHLVIAEAVVLGRTGMGERVTRGRLLDRWRMRRAGRLVFAEAIRLDGAVAERLAEAAVAAGAAAIGSLLIAPGDAEAVGVVREVAKDCRGEVGISAWNGLALARFCAKDGTALRHDLGRALAALDASGRLCSPLPRLWLN